LKEKKKEKKKSWDNSDVALFATSEFFDVSNLKRQKILTWQKVPRQNCPRIFFFFFLKKKIIFKNEGAFFFQNKLVTCNFEEIKHGVDRSLRPGETCRKREKKKRKHHLCPK
jgi:hypothetical protein